MDPITLPTVVGGCSHLALRAASLTSDFSLLRSRLRHLERHVGKVVVQVTSIKGAVSQLSQWLQRNPTERTRELLPEVSGVLECCTELIEHIGQHVSKVKAAGGGSGGGGSSTVTVAAGSNAESSVRPLDEGVLAEYQTMLQGQVQALRLMIQCLQLQTPGDRMSFLQFMERRAANVRTDIEIRPRTAETLQLQHQQRQQQQQLQEQQEQVPVAPDSRPPSNRKDSAVAGVEPASRPRLVIRSESTPTPDRDYHDFLRGGAPRRHTDADSGSSGRNVSIAPAPIPEEQPYWGFDDAGGSRRPKPTSHHSSSSFFGKKKSVGRGSRPSAGSFERLRNPEVLLAWTEWHRQQRAQAAEDRDAGVRQAVLNSGLYTAVRFKRHEYIDELIKAGAREDEREGVDWSPLHHAVQFADAATVSQLLDRGIDPDHAVVRYGSPLHYATMSANESMILLLLRGGGDPNVMDLNARPPLYLALRYLLEVDHVNKRAFSSLWPTGPVKNGLDPEVRAAVLDELRPGVRSVLLLLAHDAVTASDSDGQRWRAAVQQRLQSMRIRTLRELIDRLAPTPTSSTTSHPGGGHGGPVGAAAAAVQQRTAHDTVEVWGWLQQALRDSMREAARGSRGSAANSTSNTSSSSNASSDAARKRRRKGVTVVTFDLPPERPTTARTKSGSGGGSGGQGQQDKRSEDAERLGALLGMSLS